MYACAWQYVYGQHPIFEAEAAAAAVKAGADCLVIDARWSTRAATCRRSATSPSSGRLSARTSRSRSRASPGSTSTRRSRTRCSWARTGRSTTRRRCTGGTSASAFRTSTRTRTRTTRSTSAPSIRSVSSSPRLRPTRSAPSGRSPRIQRARRQLVGLAVRHAGRTSADGRAGWFARRFQAATTVASLGYRSAGDVVVWAQLHLIAAGESVTVDGEYGIETLDAVETFQQAHGLPVTGILTPATWAALLTYPTPAITWTQRRSKLSATVTPALMRRARRTGTRLVLPVPRSASLRSGADELCRHAAAGVCPTRRVAPARSVRARRTAGPSTAARGSCSARRR